MPTAPGDVGAVVGGVAVPGSLPPFWNEEGWRAFHKMSVRPTDVVMVSFGKTGTTWVNSILYCILRMDDNGEFSAPPASLINGNSQVYPDSLPARKSGGPAAGTGGMPGASKWDFADLEGQPEPRLFSTHLPAQLLPPALRHCGRVIYVTRNPKDTLVSKHFFRQNLVKLGRLKMPAHGKLDTMQDSYDVFNAWPPDKNVGIYGSYYSHVRGMVEYLRGIGGRGTLAIYEELKLDVRGQVSRLAAFLGISLTPRKLDAIVARCSMEEMGKRPELARVGLVRKGEVGGYAEHLTPAHWRTVDRHFDERLGDVPEVRPLRRWVGAARL